MKRNLHGTAKHLNQIYTVEGGPEKHDDNQQTKGIVELAALLLSGLGIKQLFHNIYSLTIKALVKKEEE